METKNTRLALDAESSQRRDALRGQSDVTLNGDTGVHHVAN